MHSVLSDLDRAAKAGTSQRRFGPRYMALRRETEALLRDRFIQRGGQPTRTSPHYFVLGESAWFQGLYREPATVQIDLGEIPTAQVSATYPDSVTSLGLLGQYGIHVPTRPQHGRVFRVEELQSVIDEYGLPEGAAPDTYEGHQVRDFEHYIEVQVWTDDVLPAAARR